MFSLIVLVLVDFISQEICPFYLYYKICGHRVVLSICFFTNLFFVLISSSKGYVFYFISDISNLCLPFFLRYSGQRLINLIELSKHQLLVLLISSIDFLFSIATILFLFLIFYQTKTSLSLYSNSHYFFSSAYFRFNVIFLLS